MALYTELQPGVYRDSNVLMRLSMQLKAIEGVEDAALMMGSEVNKALLRDAGLISLELEAAKPDDLCITVRSQRTDIQEKIAATISTFFEENVPLPFNDESTCIVKSLDMAVRTKPDANLVLISVPGNYAVGEAEKALQRGLNVFLFSDNISIEDEVALKSLASDHGALFMGPDCGTAIIGGVPLGFANEIRSGSIGIVAASGTGLQEVSSLVHQMGGGISHAIGTGGRDLSARVGGKTFLTGIELLNGDDRTDILVLISKPPDELVEQRVIEMVETIEKPVVICFLGDKLSKAFSDRIRFVDTLTDAANEAILLIGGDLSVDDAINQTPNPALISTLSRQIGDKRRFVVGLYTGGTLADEAALIISKELQPVRAISSFANILKLDNPSQSQGHSIIDLGDDLFTVGRPHPMIDPTTREERLMKEIENPEVGIFLFDVVLGWGSHADPAGQLAAAVATARNKLEKSNQPVFIASITGTDLDPQGYYDQKKRLEDAGIVVFPSNAVAATTVIHILKGRG